jgi:hypothetical protein
VRLASRAPLATTLPGVLCLELLERPSRRTPPIQSKPRSVSARAHDPLVVFPEVISRHNSSLSPSCHNSADVDSADSIDVVCLHVAARARRRVVLVGLGVPRRVTRRTPIGSTPVSGPTHGSAQRACKLRRFNRRRLPSRRGACPSACRPRRRCVPRRRVVFAVAACLVGVSLARARPALRARSGLRAPGARSEASTTGRASATPTGSTRASVSHPSQKNSADSIEVAILVSRPLHTRPLRSISLMGRA